MSDDLLERALDGMLSPGEEETLASRLRSEPELARRYLDLARDEALLSEWAGESRALAARPPKPAPRPGARWALPAVAALVLVGLFFVLLGPPPPTPLETAAVLVEAAGTVEILREGSLEPAPPGRAISAGLGLRTGPASTARLRFPDGASLLLHEETGIYLEPREVIIRTGTVSAQAAGLPAGRALILVTPHGRVPVLGPRFDLSVAAASTRIEVEEGRVALDRGEVAGGHVAFLEPGRPLRVEPRRGSGLRAEYFDRPDLTGLKLTRVDPRIDFSWESGSPDPLVEAGTCSARWSGRLLPRRSGLHTFTVWSDDGARLWVDGRLVIDRWQEQTRVERTGTAALEAWRFADLRLEWLNQSGPGAVRLSWEGPSLTKETIPPEALFPAPPGGTGLRAEHFGDDAFSDLKVVRIDPAVDFHWGTGSPHPTIGSDGFSSRWTGFVEPAHSGTTTFHTVSDDGVRLWVDGRLLIDDWKVRGSAERSAAVDLRAGEKVSIRLEHFDRVSTSRISLLWSSPGQPKDVVPRSRLYPP